MYTYIAISPPSCISVPPSLSHPSRWSQSTELISLCYADLPVLCGCFPLAIYFTFGSVYMSMPLSHFVPAYPSPSLCPQVRSLHLRRFLKITDLGASLVAQWLRICLPIMQGTRVRALVWEDPTCRGATGPVSHNY